MPRRKRKVGRPAGPNGPTRPKGRLLVREMEQRLTAHVEAGETVVDLRGLEHRRVRTPYGLEWRFELPESEEREHEVCGYFVGIGQDSHQFLEGRLEPADPAWLSATTAGGDDDVVAPD